METLWEKKERIRKRILAYKRQRFDELNIRQYFRQGGDEVEEKEIETVTASAKPETRHYERGGMWL